MVLFKANCTVFFCSFEVARDGCINVLNSGHELSLTSNVYSTIN